MPDSPFDGKLATHKPMPQCKALLICEGAGVDAITGQFSLFQLVNSLRFAEFPAQAQPLLVFLQLYDGIGRYILSIELRNLTDDSRVAAEVFSDLDFPERLAKMELVAPISSMRLPHAGRYKVAVLFDGQELATQFIRADPPPSEKPAHDATPPSGSTREIRMITA